MNYLCGILSLQIDRNIFLKKGALAFAFPLLMLAVFSGCGSLPETRITGPENHQLEYALIRNGTPTVLFENGLGAKMTSWNKVFPVIGQEASVFAYHRPGYGSSDPSSTPRDGNHIVEELRAFLDQQGVKPPYVLVGHSMGGLYMQLFARKYPDEITGLVLVDSTHPTQMEGAGTLEHQPWYIRLLFPVLVTGEQRREFDAMTLTGQEVLQLPTVVDKPVIILSAIDDHDNDAVRHANRKRADFMRLYPHGQQAWVESGHFIQWEKPEIVINAIHDLLPH